MEKIRIQDDLYEAVNGEWLKTAVIPSDRPTAGGFSELDQNVEKLLMEDFKNFAEGKKTTDIDKMSDAVELYKKYIDIDKRNKDGINPVLPLLNRIKNIKDVNELNANALDLDLSNMPLPFNFGVTADMNDATKNSFIVLGPSIILPDTSYYQEGNQAGAQLLQVWQNMAAQA